MVKRFVWVPAVILLLTSCTSLHSTREMFLVDQVTFNNAVQVDVVSNGIVDSRAGFVVAIRNNTDTGINFFENQVAFYDSMQQYVSCWNSYAYLNELENEYSGRLSFAAFLCDLFTPDHDNHHDRDNEDDGDDGLTFFRVASFVNLAATGIDAVTTLESNSSVLRSCYIPAGSTAYGLVFCDLPMRGNVISVQVVAGGSPNLFTFSF